MKVIPHYSYIKKRHILEMGRANLMGKQWISGGLPLDQDVYDAAEWSCLGELTAASIENKGMPVMFPDFTRGDWNKVEGYKHAVK